MTDDVNAPGELRVMDSMFCCRAQEQFDQERSRVDLVRHIFQGLILGSGIDWAANQDTADLMVGLGMPLETQLH